MCAPYLNCAVETVKPGQQFIKSFATLFKFTDYKNNLSLESESWIKIFKIYIAIVGLVLLFHNAFMALLPVYLIFNKWNIVRTKLWLVFTISHDYFVIANITLLKSSKTATYMLFKRVHLCSWLVQEIMRAPLPSLCDNLPICQFDVAICFKFTQRFSYDTWVCLDRTESPAHFVSNKTKIHVYSKVDTHIIVFRELFGRRDARLSTFCFYNHHIYFSKFALKRRQNSLHLL